jgi:amino acid efflux transporter
VLVLTGQAASLAGPASLLAWVSSCLLGIPLALTFAALAVAMPDAGGVSTYTASAFGRAAGGITGWWYFVAGSVGQTIVPLTGGYYLANALHVSQGWDYLFAAAILAAAIIANLAGAKVSSKVQVALAVSVGAVLLVASIAAIPDMRLSRLAPFAPHGIRGVGSAVVVLFYAFAGWEAIAHLVGEFRDPQRDARRATTTTLVIVSVLYLFIAIAVVLTGTWGSDAKDHVAIGGLLQDGLGASASVAAAIAALVISLGTTNAFVAAVSRLGYALSRDGWLPSPIARLSDRNVPTGGVAAVGLVGGLGMLLAWLFDLGTQQIVFIPSTLIIVVYLVGTAAAVKLLDGPQRVIAAIGTVLTACALPFALGHIIVAVLALICGFTINRHRTASTRTATTSTPTSH